MLGVTVRTLLLTCSALICFAANSLLCRAALRSGSIDAGSFMLVRIVSGALLLTSLVVLRAGLPLQRSPTRGSSSSGTARRAGWTDHPGERAAGVQRAGSWLSALAAPGSWRSAFALFVYAACFSYSYLRLDAGIGALVLFGSVQATMIGWGLATEGRPRALEWAGLFTALTGLVLLTVPGKSAPDPMGAVLMAAAGSAWGLYSLRGRGATQPLVDTAGNFLKAVPLATCLGLIALRGSHVSGPGAGLAVVSGAVTSGVGYTFWYGALPHLGSVRAAIVQLAVPVLATIGAVMILEESLSARAAASGALTLAGVAIAILGRGSRSD